MKQQQQQWWARYSSDSRNYVYLYRILSKDEAKGSHVVPQNLFLDPNLYTKEKWEKLTVILKR
jgi:hypothetical protein